MDWKYWVSGTGRLFEMKQMMEVKWLQEMPICNLLPKKLPFHLLLWEIKELSELSARAASVEALSERK